MGVRVGRREKKKWVADRMDGCCYPLDDERNVDNPE